MKLLSLFYLITFTTNVYSMEKCQNVQELFEKAQDETNNQLPDPLIDTSLKVDFLDTEICETDSGEIKIITGDHQASVKHLLLTGFYLGYGVFGFDSTYKRLNNKGGFKDHFRLMTQYIPTVMAGVGLEYGKNILGSRFYVAVHGNYIRFYESINNYAVGASIGVANGKSKYSGFAQVGVLTAFEGDLVETMPLVSIGIRYRIFRR